MNWAAYERGETLRVDDVRADDRVDASETPAGCGVVRPLGDYGLLVASSPDRGAVSETDVALVELLGTVTTAALDRVERQHSLERQNERLEEFAGAVSHDLRNPLNVAAMRVSTARRELGDAPTVDDHLAAAGEALDRMERLVDELLALARQGETAAEPAPVDLAALVEQSWAHVDADAATLAVETDRTVSADDAALARALENLFRNAVEHGGRTVTVTVGNTPAGFYVADDGPGLPVGAGQEVFEAGYSTAEDGTGFGLRIVREVARAHGWSVAATESAGGGARVEFSGVEVLEDDS